MKFRPPKSIRIGGYLYKVVIEPGLDRKTDVPAQVSYWKRTIYLDPECCFIKSLLHEVVHVVGHDRQLDLDEQNVERLASGLVALIRDNLPMMRQLLDVLEAEQLEQVEDEEQQALEAPFD